MFICLILKNMHIELKKQLINNLNNNFLKTIGLTKNEIYIFRGENKEKYYNIELEFVFFYFLFAE
jgi:hypothetical protein